MCGIAGFHIKNPKAKRTEEAVNIFVDNLLLGIEDRGKQATGFVAVTEDKRVILDKGALIASEFIKDRDRIPADVRTVLLHTRYATKGEVTNNSNNHPVVYKSCFTTHNGSISNDDDLFREFSLTRNYEVDTEIIPALLDKHGLGDLAHIKEALTKFRGPLAIATIDPVNHPHKLLLAKGIQSPLVVFENDNMVVWASLMSALRDAWGSVFGTPPRNDKFNYMQEGQLLLIDGDEVVKDKYEVARPFGGSNRSGSHMPAWQRNQSRARAHQRQIRSNGSNYGTSGGDGLWASATALFTTEDQFKKAVKWYREQGRGNARLWSNRDKLDDKVDFSDVPKGEPISWVSCKCGEAVLAQDIRTHLKHGHVCVDCYVVIREAYEEKASKHNNVVSIDAAKGKQLLALGRGSEDEIEFKNIPEKDRENMETWAAVEAQAHVLILAAVAAASSYSAELVDFLVFRTGEMVHDFGKGMIDLKTQLTAAYHAATPVVWEEHGEDLLRGAPVQRPEPTGPLYDDSFGDGGYTAYTVKKSGGISELWYNCPEHSENFRQGDDCPVCAKVNESLDEILRNASKDKQQCDECGLEFPRYQLTHVEKENYLLCGDCIKYFADPCAVQDKKESEADEAGKLSELKRCSECKTFMSSKYPCKVCEVRATREPEPVDIERLVNIKPEIKSVCKGNGDGKPCRRKVRYCVGNIGGYCKRHFESCSVNACIKKANTILANGSRVCHGHSRGQQGSFADKALQKSGVVFQEVR